MITLRNRVNKVVISVIARNFPRVVKAIRTYQRYESKLYDDAYRGFPRYIKRGVRHGGAIGAGVGSIFTPSGDEDLSSDGTNGQHGLPKKSRAHQFRQIRRRRFGRSNKYKKYCPPGCRSKFKKREHSGYRM